MSSYYSGEESPASIYITIETRSMNNKVLAKTERNIACYPLGLCNASHDFNEYSEKLGNVIAQAVKDNAEQVRYKMFGEGYGK